MTPARCCSAVGMPVCGTVADRAPSDVAGAVVTGTRADRLRVAGRTPVRLYCGRNDQRRARTVTPAKAATASATSTSTTVGAVL